MLHRPLRRIDVARSWQLAREEFARLVAERNAMLRRHVDELDAVRHELHDLRSIFADVVATLRQQAEFDVATLRRKLEIALARLERNPTRPLQ